MPEPTPFESLRIDTRRLENDLAELARIGRNDESSGLHRRAFTAAEAASRAWLAEKLESAGLEPRVDGAVNLGARWPDALAGPCVMTGSHLDTVPGAGRLDGALGVVAGLEALRVISEHQIELTRPVELVAFSDEEGRFGGMFGSQAMSGKLTPETIDRAVDLDGISLEQAMAEAGLHAHDALAAEREPGSIHAFVELHIEQGPVLEREGASIGLVDAITGLFRWDVRFIGEANHAGTTPMDMRRDAFRGVAEFTSQIEALLEGHGGTRSRATIGRIELVPGAANVVPGEARFSLEVRDTEAATLTRLATEFRRALNEISQSFDLKIEIEAVSQIEPVACHGGVTNAVTNACESLGLPCFTLPSGAAHDTQMIADIAPAGMIFVPSRGGRSHSPAEWTAPADIERGANVLLQSLIELAR